MRPEVALLLILSFVPIFGAVIAIRAWINRGDPLWPAPLSVIAGVLIITAFPILLWKFATGP